MHFFDILQGIPNMMKYCDTLEDLKKARRNQFHPGQPISKRFDAMMN